MEQPTPIDDLLAALDPLPLAVFLVAPDRRIAGRNRVAAALFPAAPVGADFVQAVRHPECLRALEATLSEARETTLELTLSRPVNASYRVHSAPPAGEIIGVGAVISFEDITERRGAEAMRSAFVANVSHELRSPLTALGGFIETLKSGAGDDPEARSRFLEIMESEAGRMNRLIGDLLSLSRVEEEERLRPAGRVRLAPLLRRVVAMLETQAGAAGVTLTLHTDAPDDDLPGDEDQLQQVFLNLAENALRYGGKTVEITLPPPRDVPGIDGPALVVSVRDDGPGIAPEHRVRLTERFYRIDDSRSRALGGTGLGLAIVKHIVARHRGRLMIESQPGEGSTFSVALPLA